jgi:hypothetical protein
MERKCIMKRARPAATVRRAGSLVVRFMALTMLLAISPALAVTFPGNAAAQEVNNGREAGAHEPAAIELTDHASPQNDAQPSVAAVCGKIEAEAVLNGIPPGFFARLIWKESRFDHRALSPAGAQGIAQFMPGTAKLRGLADPWNWELALQASARYLAELGEAYGNLGLAAAAYNAGEARVDAWLLGRRYLPMETEDYVADIAGQPAENFIDRNLQTGLRELEAGIPFQDACLKLPVMKTRTAAMASIPRKPWGVQIAGNFRQPVAVASARRLERQLPVLKNYKMHVQQIRSPRGRRSFHAVRIGADSRSEANAICSKIRSAGGACMVAKN